MSGQAGGVGDGLRLVGGRDGASAGADQDAALGHGRAQRGSPGAYDRRLAVTRGRERLAAAAVAVAAAAAAAAVAAAANMPGGRSFVNHTFRSLHTKNRILSLDGRRVQV